jgi:subtilisin family serine protease
MITWAITLGRHFCQACQGLLDTSKQTCFKCQCIGFIDFPLLKLMGKENHHEKNIKGLGFEIKDQDRKAALVVIEDPKGGVAAAKRLRELSAIHGVRFIRERVFKRTSNDVAEKIMGTRATLDSSELGLSGKGEVIAVCDTGIDTADTQTIHKDFAGRIKATISYPITRDFASYVNNPGGDDGAADLDSGHGTHVAGSVLGNGSASLDLPGHTTPIRGLAYKAKLVFQAIEQEMKWKNPAYYQKYGRYLLSGIPLDLTRLFSDAYRQKARIHSNSWGGGAPGEYDSQSEQLDRFVWEHKDFCVLVAFGLSRGTVSQRSHGQ